MGSFNSSLAGALAAGLVKPAKNYSKHERGASRLTPSFFSMKLGSFRRSRSLHSGKKVLRVYPNLYLSKNSNISSNIISPSSVLNTSSVETEQVH